MLFDNRVTHSPDILDPLLRGKKDSYAQGLISSILGFVPNDDVKFKVPKTDTNAVKNSDWRETGKSEGLKRSTSSSSERSGASKS